MKKALCLLSLLAPMLAHAATDADMKKNAADFTKLAASFKQNTNDLIDAVNMRCGNAAKATIVQMKSHFGDVDKQSDFMAHLTPELDDCAGGLSDAGQKKEVVALALATHQKRFTPLDDVLKLIHDHGSYLEASLNADSCNGGDLLDDYRGTVVTLTSMKAKADAVKAYYAAVGAALPGNPALADVLSDTKAGKAPACFNALAAAYAK